MNIRIITITIKKTVRLINCCRLKERLNTVIKSYSSGCLMFECSMWMCLKMYTISIVMYICIRVVSSPNWNKCVILPFILLHRALYMKPHLRRLKSLPATNLFHTNLIKHLKPLSTSCVSLYSLTFVLLPPL